MIRNIEMIVLMTTKKKGKLLRKRLNDDIWIELKI